MWRIAIPSYHRAQRLKESTLSLLRSHQIPSELIDVFVADEEQRALYAATLEPGTYHQLIIGVSGMMAIRNFMTDYYAEGQHILFIDDDIRMLMPITPSPINLRAFIDSAFAKCVETHLRLWGIYPVSNRFFMRDDFTEGLTYIVGCFYGVINNRSIHVSLDDKEDFERTMLYFQTDGGVLRYRNLAPVTRYYREPGGMMVTRTAERILASAQTLYDRYPDMCRLNLTKKSGHPEVRLLRLKRRTSV